MRPDSSAGRSPHPDSNGRGALDEPATEQLPVTSGQLFDEPGESRRGWRAFGSIIQAGVTGRPLFSTTSRGVDFAIMVATVGARAVLLIQMVASVFAGFEKSTRADLYGVYFALGAGWSVVFIVLIFRTRQATPPWLARADILVACGCLGLQPFVVHGAYDSWVNWGYVYGLNVLSAAGCARLRRGELTAGASAITLLYVLTRLNEAGVVYSAVLTNAVSLVVFPILTRAFSGYLRRLGADADDARAAAVVAERERHQLLLHDSATILQLLAGGELPPVVDEAVRRQAVSESNRIRSFLTGADFRAGSPDSPLLTNVIAGAVQPFSDLAIDVVTDLAGAVQVSPAQASALRLAISGLLSNVRIHAMASHVVLHGDWDDAESEWEIVLRDDGVGFDRETTPEGFGLAAQVRKSLAAQGISSLVQSAPGKGTVAVLRGPDYVFGRQPTGSADTGDNDLD